MRTRTDRALVTLVTLGGLTLLWLALVQAPSVVGREGFTAPLTWKLFFFHVPIAFAAFAAYGIAFGQSLAFLVRPHARRDRAAHAAVEVGVVFSLLTLATGMVWGQAEWGRPWSWDDAKLVLVLVMSLVYVAYLFLRREVEDADRRARIAATYAVAGFATVPLTWFAHRIWATTHPVVFADPGGGGLETPGILPIFLFGLVLFLLILTTLFRWRLRLLETQNRYDELAAAREALP